MSASAKYRVNTVTIEGFGGFTNAQTIDLSQKHAFVFGPNGRGKSSILEAIRWCLFGQAQRPDAEVRNIYYPLNECSVTIELAASTGSLTLRRRLRPGAARSDLTITDAQGKDFRQAEVFPHLARLGPKEGTHIIVAGQQAAARRPQADISDFSRVLYSYLDIDDVPVLTKSLHELVEEKTTERDKLAGDLEALIAAARGRLAKVELQLAELMQTSPWNSTTPPVLSETTRKVDAFYREIIQLTGQPPQDGLTSEQKLNAAEAAAKQLTGAARSEVEAQLKFQRTRLAALQNAYAGVIAAREQHKTAAASQVQLQGQLATVLDGQTPEKLAGDLQILTDRMSYQELKAEILDRVTQLYSRDPFDRCPICATDGVGAVITKSVSHAQEDGQKYSEDLSKKATNLRQQIQKASELSTAIKQASSDIARHKVEEQNALAALAKTMDQQTVPTDADVALLLAALNESIAALSSQLTDVGQAIAEREKSIKALRGELRFHVYQQDATRIRRILTDSVPIPRGVFDEYQSLLRTTTQLKELINAEFDKVISKAIPKLNDMMTDVYTRLTQQLSFDKVIIEKTGNTLALLVGSTRRPGQFNPDDVLNGQANSALRLVPYFVFSEFQHEALELELLLIDDPSQSFDTSHVEILLEELHKIASRTQLVIASHEREKFEAAIAKYFPKEGMRIVGVDVFDPLKGPSVVYAH